MNIRDKITEAVEIHKAVHSYVEGLAAGLRRVAEQGPSPELRAEIPEGVVAEFTAEALEVAGALEVLASVMMTRPVAALVMGHAAAEKGEEEITFTSSPRHRAQA